MSRSAVEELDFFRMEKEMSLKSQPRKLFDRRRSFKDIQNVISKLNPDLLKSLIESGSVNQTSIASKKNSFSSVPSTPKSDQTFFQSLPVFIPNSRPCSEHIHETTSPMTIFYNGTVTVFDVPPHKAENIFKVAEQGLVETMESTDSKPPTDGRQFLEILRRDLPLARKKSLERFLEKRKERLTLASPYGYGHHPNDHAVSGYYNKPGPKD